MLEAVVASVLEREEHCTAKTIRSAYDLLVVALVVLTKLVDELVRIALAVVACRREGSSRRPAVELRVPVVHRDAIPVEQVAHLLGQPHVDRGRQLPTRELGAVDLEQVRGQPEPERAFGGG